MNLNASSLTILCRHLRILRITSPEIVLGSRYLYTPSAIGLESYLQVRERINMQFSEMADRFRSKMRDFADPNSANMVFTDDLKHMIHMAEGTEEDLKLIEDMMIKFNKQSRNLRFGSYVFGPVVMRMYYYLNKPKEALQAFMDPNLDHFFDQVSSFQILMDLLFKNEMYDEVMQVADIVRDKQLPNARYPKSVVVLTIAAAYKKNTPESFEYMKTLWAALQETGHEPMRRAIAFAAALAINQNAPHIAVELLSDEPKQSYVTIRNLKVSALADLNRPDDALPILRSVLEFEGATDTKHTFVSEVIDKVKAVVDNFDQKEVHQEFKRIHEQLIQLEHISNIPLDTVLCSEIDKHVRHQYQHTDQRVLAMKFGDRGGRLPRPQRYGLRDIE